MQFKGINFRRDRYLGFRNGEEGDATTEGNPIPKNYLVFVDLRDCPVVNTVERPDGQTVKIVRPEGVKPRKRLAISGHSRTNMAYGVRKEAYRHAWDAEKTPYTPVFLAYDGFGYVGKIWHEVDRDSEDTKGDE